MKETKEQIEKKMKKLEEKKREIEAKEKEELEKKAEEEKRISLEAERIKEKNKVIRFPADTEAKLIKELSNMLPRIEEEGITEEDMVANDWGITDCAFVMMIGGKSNKAKRVLARFLTKESEKKNMPKWDFINKEVSKSRFSLEYIEKIVNFLKITDDAIDISVINNHPIQIENKEFVCILAPRIEQDG